MTAEIDICATALGHIGEDSNISSIDPPEGSEAAEHCARFYPQARDYLQSVHDFGFNTREIDGALLVAETEGWQYVYAVPNDALNVFAVLPRDATNNYYTSYDVPGQLVTNPLGNYSDALFNSPPRSVTADYELGTLSNGARVIYTNQVNAKIRYGVRITDSTKFTPLFIQALGFMLASYLAGPIIKGREGREVARAMRETALAMFAVATTRDANQQQRRDVHIPSWIGNR